MADALARSAPPQTAAHARAQVEAARARLEVAAGALKAELRWLKLPGAVTASMNRFPLLWLGGAFAVGAVLGTLSRRSRGDE